MTKNIDGIVGVEHAARFTDNHRIINAPMDYLLFYPGGDYHQAVDLRSVLGENFVIDLLQELKNTEAVLATLNIDDDKLVKGCSIEFRGPTSNIVTNKKPQIYVIHYLDGSGFYPFTARCELSALRCFMGLFTHRSEPITKELINHFGIDSLRRFYPESGEWVTIFPLDDDWNNRCQKMFLDYRELMVIGG